MKRPTLRGSRRRQDGDTAALMALASATRQEIVDVLTSAGPSTIAQLAEWLGRRPDALYFHVRALQRAGLVVECEVRRVGGRTTAVFGIARPVTLDYAGPRRRELARVVRMAIRLVQREFERACIAGAPAGAGPGRTLWGGRIMGWASPAELARINELIAELHTVLRSGRPGPNRKALAVGFLLAPAGFAERNRRTRSGQTRTKEKT